MIRRKNSRNLFKIILSVIVLFSLLAGVLYKIFKEEIAFSSKILQEIKINFKKMSMNHLNSLKIQGVTLMDREEVVGVAMKEVVVTIETIDVFSKRKTVNADFLFEGVTSILNLDKVYADDGSFVKSLISQFLKVIIHDDLVSSIINSGQKYTVVWNLFFSENNYFKINNFKAYSEDVHLEGEYEYYNSKDVVHAEVFISFSPEMTIKYSDLIGQYRLEKDDNGWYGFVYEVTGPAAFIRGISGLLISEKD